jgi:serine/threonine protein kinase
MRGPGDWTRDEVCEFVRDLCLPDLAEHFQARDATGADLVAYANGPTVSQRDAASPEVSRRVLARVLKTLAPRGFPPPPCKPDLDQSDIRYGSSGTCGGNGIVHFAMCNGENVAVKVARSGSGLDIMKEARILRSLRKHRNIVAYKGFANDCEVGPCLVLALADLTLYEAVHACTVPLDTAEIIDITVGIAAGLAHLHDAGVVHLDLKSPNVLLSSDNLVPKICDFGHAAFRRSGQYSPHNVLGTPITASPEVVLEAPVSFPADIWSLGVLMVEMFTASLPFKGLTYSQVIVAVAYCAEPIQTNFTAPPECREIASACLQRDPRARPTAQDVQAKLLKVSGEAQTAAVAALEAFHMVQVEEPLPTNCGAAHPNESCFAGIARMIHDLWL